MKPLLEKAQRGDAAAFEQLFLPHEAQLYRVAFLYTKNEADALDVVQETAYRAFLKIGAVRQPEYFKTWLVSIAVHCALDLLRQRQRLLPLEEQPAQKPMTEQPEQAILQKLTLQQLLTCLTPQQKTVLVLRYSADLSFAQIAQQMQLPQGTVKTLHYRALKKLNAKAKENDWYE
ncbi:MAG: sigma-70 family RNA polymerase sigma factor [Faecalibacterium sp.]|nr:sigma-70 family RNA polymerase sigma factor [Faecalibacterium sp.]